MGKCLILPFLKKNQNYDNLFILAEILEIFLFNQSELRNDFALDKISPHINIKSPIFNSIPKTF